MTTAAAAPHLSADACVQSLRRLRKSGLVRLDDEETLALAAALDGVEAHSIELFGSRTDPASRGGDIDILVLSTAHR
ncbi:MAG: hypothetical protein ACR2IT_09285, partial [Pirellulales bacterium]